MGAVSNFRWTDARCRQVAQQLVAETRIALPRKKDKAIELQQKAVDLAEGDVKEKFQGVLDGYKKGKLPSAD